MKRFWSELTRPTPADLATLPLNERLRACLPANLRDALPAKGVDLAACEWVLPLDLLFSSTVGPLGARTQASPAALGSFCGSHFVCGMVQGELQFAEIAPSHELWKLHVKDGEPAIQIELTGTPFSLATVTLANACGYGAGSWWKALQARHDGNVFDSSSSVAVANVVSSGLEKGKFGLRTLGTRAPGVVFLKGDALHVWPDGWEVPIARSAAWEHDGAKTVGVCLADAHGVFLVELEQITCAAEPAFGTELAALAAARRPAVSRLRPRLEASGLFPAQGERPETDGTLWLCKDEGKLARDPFGDHDSPGFTTGYVCQNRVVLCNLSGDAFAVQGDASALGDIQGRLAPMEELRGAAAGPWGVFISGAQNRDERRPLIARVSPQGLQIATDGAIPWRAISVASGNPGSGSLTLARAEYPGWRLDLSAPPALLTSLLAEVDVRATDSVVATESPGQLYARLAALRRDSFLFLLLGDVAALLSEFESGGNLANAARILESTSPEKMGAEEKRAVESASTELVALAAALPHIKQRFELLSLEGPYGWAEQEREWLRAVFGAEWTRTAGQREYDRGRDLLARSVRALLAPMQRSIAELEAAIRPLDTLFFRDDVQSDFWIQLRRRGNPLAVSVTMAAASMIFSGGAALPVVLPTLGLGLNQLLSSETEKLIRDREKVLTLRRAAQVAADWLELLRRGAAVTASEAARFIDRENVRAAQRDRLLFEQCPAAHRPAVLQKLRSEVQRRSACAARAAALELAPGSQKRLGNLTRYVARLADRSAIAAAASTS